MPDTEIELIDKSNLITELRSCKKEIIILDCRSPNDYAISHILNATNITLPTIMLRRLKEGKTDLFSTIKCKDLKNRILGMNVQTLFVLYHNGSTFPDVMQVLSRKLKAEFNDKKIRVVCLADGFMNFQASFPEWCQDERSNMQSNSSSEQLMGLRRKSMTGNWKTNQGSAMLEQLPITEKYKNWIDEVAELFGGMEICAITVVVGKDNKEYILKASDCTFSLIGDTQEEDRRTIADIVSARMQNVCRPPLPKSQSRPAVNSRGGSPTEETPPISAGPRSSITGSFPQQGPPPPIPERQTPGVGSIARHGSLSGSTNVDSSESSAPSLASTGRRDSQASQSSQSGSKAASNQPRPSQQSSVVDEAEDTMKNLRKTFAGIFGDM